MQVVGALKYDSPEALRMPLGGAATRRAANAPQKENLVCAGLCVMNRLIGLLPRPGRVTAVCKHMSH